MHADLDTLCNAVYCTADDLLPEAPGNGRRRVSDAEVVTLCVAQAIMGIPSDRRFLAVAAKRLCHLFPELPAQPGFHKRRLRLSDTIEWLDRGELFPRSTRYHGNATIHSASAPSAHARDRPWLGASKKTQTDVPITMRRMRLPKSINAPKAGPMPSAP